MNNENLRKGLENETHFFNGRNSVTVFSIDLKKNKNKFDKGICDRTTRGEKILGILALLITIIITIIVTFVIMTEIPIVFMRSNVCYTAECTRTAAKLLEAMDQSIDPCNDFYKYACGSFITSTSIKEDKKEVSFFTEVEDDIVEQIRTLLVDEDIDHIRPFNLARDYYQSCMNISNIEKLGHKPITEIADKLGGWPVLIGDWNNSNWSLEDTLIELRKLGLAFDYILDIYVYTDPKNSSKNVIMLDQTSNFGIYGDNLIVGFNDKLVKSYYNYMIDIATLFGAERENAEDELRKCLDFEISLAKISVTEIERKNLTHLYNPISISELGSNYTQFEWLKIINGIVMQGITPEEIVIEVVPIYFQKLDALLSETPTRTIANYIFWRIYKGAISSLSEDLRDRQTVYFKEILGVTQREPRWRECVYETRMRLHALIGSMYIRRYFPEVSKISALKMVSEIKTVFKKILLEAKWMNNRTRELSLLKLDKMIFHIGYPEELLDNQKLIDYYNELNINVDFYFKSLQTVNRFLEDKNYEQLKKKVNRNKWWEHSDSAQIEAFYNNHDNSINVPAGFLQGKFFSADRPNYLNYGGIGCVIAHEITHGFDNIGRQFNHDGNLADWWDYNTTNAFLTRARGIVEQYGNYTDETTKLKINGILTEAENIADNGGVKGSYLAYNEWSRQNKNEPKLPGFQDFSPNQMFWISMAQNFCSKERPELLKLLITSDLHSPNHIRVLGVLRNSKEFSKDFNCPDESKMNPIEKHEVW